ncbi:EamA family transporter [Bacillus lacus]|uniref:EamA family transporter n=1 Tax=Metabacillus lacus TaxID=1983721 RepID=A0A7X2IX70_9BACI|nr:DMT family transporter [Metabacillus lacus]MRX71112.1 EamA family transporter [Metabacillus lacus]
MNKLYGALCLSAAASIWGGMYVVSKVVLEQVTPWVLLEMRFLLGFLVLFALAALRRETAVEKSDHTYFAMIAIVGYTGSIGMQFIGTHLSNASMGSLITSASPAFISLFAVWVLREKLTGTKGFALLLATIGVFIVIGLPGDAGGSESAFTGNVVLLGAAVTWALYTVLSRVQTKKYSSLTVTMWVSLYGVIFTLPLAAGEAVLTPASIDWSASLILGILYLGVVSTAGAFYLWNKGFEYMDAATGSLFFFLQPIVGTLLGFALLNEPLNLNFLAGGALIAAGIYLANLQPRKLQAGSDKAAG